MLRDRPVQVTQRCRECAVPRHRRPKLRHEFVAHRRIVDAQHAPVADHRCARPRSVHEHDARWCAQTADRADRGRRADDRRRPHSNRAGACRRAAQRRGRRPLPYSSTERRPFLNAIVRMSALLTSTRNPVPPCSRCASRISRRPSSSSSNASPSRPNATRQPRRTISASGAMPERIPRFELVLTEMVAPRSAISSSSSGRAHVQCASVRRSLSRPMVSRYLTIPCGNSASAHAR